MKIARFLIHGMLCVSPMRGYAQPADQMKSMAVIGVQLSGGHARIAADICQIAQEQINAYRNRMRKAYAADEAFGGNWIIGWNNQQHAVDNITALKANRPDEYTQKLSKACSEMGDEMNP